MEKGENVFQILDDSTSHQADALETWMNNHKPSQVTIKMIYQQQLLLTPFQLRPDNSLEICLEAFDDSEEQEEAARNEWNSIKERRKTLKTVHNIASKYQIKGEKAG